MFNFARPDVDGSPCSRKLDLFARIVGRECVRSVIIFHGCDIILRDLGIFGFNGDLVNRCGRCRLVGVDDIRFGLVGFVERDDIRFFIGFGRLGYDVER